MLPSGAIAWHSKTQSITALTSTEAQFLLLSLLLNPFFLLVMYSIALVITL